MKKTKYARMTKREVKEQAAYMTYSWMQSKGQTTISEDSYTRLLASFEREIYREYLRKSFAEIDDTYTRMNDTDNSRVLANDHADSLTAYEAAEERAIWRYEEEMEKRTESVFWTQDERDDFWERILSWEMRKIN